MFNACAAYLISTTVFTWRLIWDRMNECVGSKYVAGTCIGCFRARLMYCILIIIEGSETVFDSFQYQFTTGKPMKKLKLTFNCYENSSTYNECFRTRLVCMYMCICVCICLHVCIVYVYIYVYVHMRVMHVIDISFNECIECIRRAIWERTWYKKKANKNIHAYMQVDARGACFMYTHMYTHVYISHGPLSPHLF